MAPITIIHISDLHISEHLLQDPEDHLHAPHRYGHDVTAFLALDDFLRRSKWDLLLITGDVSRIGNSQSFTNIKNWLENEITLEGIKVGLNLSKIPERKYVIIPGNHDRFGGKTTQRNLDKYHKEFPEIRNGHQITFNIHQRVVNVHPFNSTWNKGGFAYGKIEQKALSPKTMVPGEINLAVLHHHFLQPPGHPRELMTELTNSADVAAYMLNTDFNGIFFGHTHRGYIGEPSVQILSTMLNDRRKKSRFWAWLVPNILLRKQEESCLVSYKREAAKNGQFPKLEVYFDYLFLLKTGEELFGPSQFKNIRGFYKQMERLSADNGVMETLREAKKKKILISCAPSACQAEAPRKGFHVVTINEANGIPGFSWERYEFNGSTFKIKATTRNDGRL